VILEPFVALTFWCPQCDGNGWQPGPDDWWIYCPTCKGECSWTLNGLANKLEEDPKTLERLVDLRIRSRVKTCTRILDKLIAMMG
jgi:hypothetical protein